MKTFYCPNRRQVQLYHSHAVTDYGANAGISGSDGVIIHNNNSTYRRINIEEISNTVFDGARAVCTKLRVSNRPSDACLKEIAAFAETLHVDVVTLPNLA